MTSRHTVAQVSILFAFLAGPPACQAQEALTLEQAVAEATDRYPATRAAKEDVSSAAAAIHLARTAYLPSATLFGQANRATRNNVFGMLLPQSQVASISGPVLAGTDMNSVWGSAVSFLVSWEPFDLGLRRANVELSEAGRHLALAAADRTRFEDGASTAAAFLTVLAAEQTAVAAKAGVERSRVLAGIVDSLVRAQLRPGADASRARAELAAAENQLIQAEQAIQVAKAALGQYVDRRPSDLNVSSGRLLDLPGDTLSSESATNRHPQAIEQESVVQQAQAADRAIARSYVPRFSLQAASYARGTGAMTNGDRLGGLSGLGPNIFNWGLGVSVSFPIMDLPAVRARRDVEKHRELAETARLDQIRRELSAQVEKARAELEGARRIARNTPVQLEAARAADQQATARYQAGLGTLVEVAEAQRLVTQAEIDDSLARLNVWRALLSIAVAAGDITAFVRQAAK